MADRLGRPVVVGVDGSRPALDAVRWAAEEARRHGLGVRLVNGFGFPDTLPVDEAGGRGDRPWRAGRARRA